MLLNIMIFSLSLVSFFVFSFLIYDKVIQPLASINQYIKEASFEHVIISKLEGATKTQGLADSYNLMLENNLAESNYFDRLKQNLGKQEKSDISQRYSKPSSALLFQAKLLYQQKKQIKYH